MLITSWNLSNIPLFIYRETLPTRAHFVVFLQSPQAVLLHLPRVTNNEDKASLRRTKSHERPRSNPSPFPLMQIAEKYRKELRELNGGTLHLPTHAQGDSKEDVDSSTAEPQTPQLKKTWKDEVEVAKEANSMNELEKEEQSTIIAEISEGEPFPF